MVLSFPESPLPIYVIFLLLPGFAFPVSFQAFPDSSLSALQSPGDKPIAAAQFYVFVFNQLQDYFAISS